MIELQLFKKLGFVQTNRLRLKKELYKLLYRKSYWPITASEHVVFRPKAEMHSEVLALLDSENDPIKTDAKGVVTAFKHPLLD